MLDNMNALTDAFELLIQSGYRDEDAVIELFRQGRGLLLICRVLANHRKISTGEAQRLALQWTKDISVSSEVSLRGIRILKDNVVEGLMQEGLGPEKEIDKEE